MILIIKNYIKKKIKKHNNSNSIFIICLFFFSFSLFCFYSLEPSIDQIRQISWAKELNDSEYFINLKKITNFEDFFLDKKSFFINLFRTAYFDIGHLFNLLPIFILYILNFTKISNIYIFNTLSILFFSLNIYLTYLISRFYLQNFFKKENFIFQTIFQLSLINFYTFFFSPLGIHNFSLFFYLILFYYLINTFFLKKKLKILNIFVITIMGIFSHKINIILSLSCASLFLIIKNKIKFLIKYLFFISLTIFPIFIIYLFFPKILSPTIKFTEISWSHANFFNNFYMWFIRIYDIAGSVTSFFFFFGIYYLKKINKNYKILLIPVFVHLAITVFVNSFKLYYLRTFLYIAPFISIISFYGFYNLYQNINLSFIKKILFFLFISNIVWNFSLIYKNSISYDKDTEIINEYFKKNLKIKKSLINLNKIIQNDKIIFFNNVTEDYFKIYQYNLYKKNTLDLKPISNLNKNNYSSIAIHPIITLITITSSDSEIIKVFENTKKNTNYFKNCKLDNKYFYKQDDLINGNYSLYVHKIYCSN